MYWASSCGGCEVSVANLHEKILEVDRNFDFMFCPCLMDTKEREIEALPDGAIALTFFNGAIRTDENEHMAHLLRRKTQTLVAFGSCARGGCIPALSNLHTRAEHLQAVYHADPTAESPNGVEPRPVTCVPEGELRLPVFHDRVRALAQVVDVDYFIPGCPPESHQIWAVVKTVIEGGPLPPKGSVLGAGESTVCRECRRRKDDKRVARFYRTWEIQPDSERCLLEQGIVCMGVATRDGCGALCPQVNMPCIGCYGPPEGVLDQGARMVAALGSVLDLESDDALRSLEHAVPDMAGTFYRFSLADSILGGRR
ncbi:MAG TPA: hypothetical protein VGF59_05935 [Bryobacteraceae bacterium]